MKTLSDKMITKAGHPYILYEKDIKEFITDLKEILANCSVGHSIPFDEIDKLLGDKLITW